MSKTPRSKSVTGWMKSAKERAYRVAGDRSALMQSMVETARHETQRLKAKAQSVAEAAAAAAAAASGTSKVDECKGSSESSRRFPYRPRSRHAVRTPSRKVPGGDAMPSESDAATGSDETKVESLTKAGWSPVAARLALCRSSGGVKSASTWLADEANAEEVLAAEAAEMWAAELLESKGQKSSSPAPDCAEDLSAKEDDDGCGLGPFRPQSPKKVPELSDEPVTPAREVRATISDSPGFITRLFQKDEELEGLVRCTSLAFRYKEDHDESLPAQSSSRRLSDAPTQASATSLHARRFSDAPTQASTGQSNPGGCCSEDEQEVDEIMESHEELVLPEPPDGGSWEWPLSRQEKKARVQLVDRQMNQLDRKALIQALIRERMISRAGQE
eukprot:TRINITY_DN2436_c0_g2_i2.p1 TRINITY_DN2436_c0_g2~~TRINITY_DN2436_c0_g2_i2.p1  ORF type:complete len:388 (+),score=87.40 TRINITY_DN2436_c0_g2_i2:96-1259(+)